MFLSSSEARDVALVFRVYTKCVEFYARGLVHRWWRYSSVKTKIRLYNVVNRRECREIRKKRERKSENPVPRKKLAPEE